MKYILMEPMYEGMTTGKVEKYIITTGDKVKKGMPVAEVISEGYFTLTSQLDGVVKEFFVDEEEYVPVGTPLIELE